MGKGLTVLMWVCTLLAAIGFIVAGLPKILQIPAWVSSFEEWQYPAWFLIVVGIWEVIGAVSLLVPRTTVWGAIWLMPIILGAAYTHIRFDPLPELFRPLIFLILISVAAFLRRRSQKMKTVAT